MSSGFSSGSTRTASAPAAARSGLIQTKSFPPTLNAGWPYVVDSSAPGNEPAISRTVSQSAMTGG